MPTGEGTETVIGGDVAARPRAAAPLPPASLRSGAGRRAETGARSRPGAPPSLPLVLLALPLLFLLVAPLAALAWRALGEGEGWTPEAMAALRQAMGLSLVTSATATALIVAFGTPLAYALARRRFRGARLVDLLIDLPIVLPPSVAGIALLLAFGRFGLFGRWLDAAGVTLAFSTPAVILAQTFVAAPFFVRAAAGAFARVDRDLEEIAADLGASPPRAFRTVTLPLALPAVVAGMVLAWARALGEFGATIMFAGNFPGVTQTMPLAIYGRFGAGDLETALLLAVVLLLASVLVLAAVRALAGRGVAPG